MTKRAPATTAQINGLRESAGRFRFDPATIFVLDLWHAHAGDWLSRWGVRYRPEVVGTAQNKSAGNCAGRVVSQ